jgi:Icc-related predicted phosphoesterase
LEGGDLLIIGGDLTARDIKDELLHFHHWITHQNYKKTIIVAGNHDTVISEEGYLFYNRPWALDGYAFPFNEITYLEDSATEFIDYYTDERGILTGRCFRIWGSPWTRTFKGMNPLCKAFTLDTEEELAEKFQKIPLDTDILITHSPPYGVQDLVVTGDRFIEGHQCDKFEHVGSEALMTRVSRFTNLKLHVFGHIHEGYGVTSGLFVNASHVNEHYKPVNKPIRIVL